MQTIKTATVVVLMLAVLYGVYVVLNKPAFPPNHPLSWRADDRWSRDESDAGPVRIQVGSQAEDGEVSHRRGSAPESESDTKTKEFRRLGLNSEGFPRVEISTSEVAERPKSKPFRRIISDNDSATSQSISPPSFLVAESDNQADSPDVGGEHLGQPTPDSKPLPEQPSSYVAPGRSAGSLDPLSPENKSELSSKTDSKKKASGTRPDDVLPRDTKSEPDELSDSTATPSESESSDTPTVKSVKPFQRALASARTKLDMGQFYEALLTLSVFYDNPDLTADEDDLLLDLLDPLAGKVVYSTEHLIEPAHHVRDGETLDAIATKYKIPAALLRNINGLSEEEEPSPGTQLKIVTGPFRAEISLERREMTLFVRRLYAGRFAISLGTDPEPKPGEFTIQEKSPGRIFVQADGTTISADDPRNPYGGVWLGLSDSVCIHGSSESDPDATPISLGLSTADARDVYSILSEGSNVIIR